MSAQSSETSGTEAKGKGKVVEHNPPQDTSMEDEEDSSEEESGPEDHDAEEEDADNMEEIDTDNIIGGGRRTRGKNIDFAKAAEENPEDEDDEDDDEDFEAPDEDEEMQG